jgi:D-3-phosphoglycerate dehydrogenase
MKKPLVLLTNPIDPAGMDILSPHADIRQATATDHDTLRREVTDADLIIVRAFLPPDLIDHAPRLLACMRHGAGVDLIPVEAATRAGVMVTNVPGVNAQTVAEYCVAQFLQHARGTGLANRLMRNGGWAAARVLADRATEIHGKTVGIVGVGDIGNRLATICHHGFGMRVIGYRRRPELMPPIVQSVPIDQVFAEADYVALCCPLTPETRHLADARRLGLMRPHAFLVNVSRGPVVDQAALVAALRAGSLGGAGLDVFETQPLPAGDPLLGLDNALLTPHLAGLSAEAMRAMSVVAAGDAVRILAGEKPLNFINPEAWPAAQARRAALAARKV